MMRRISLLVLMATSVLLAGCGSGMVRRVSDPAVSVQQLTVKADGQWVVELRLQQCLCIQIADVQGRCMDAMLCETLPHLGQQGSGAGALGRAPGNL